MATEKDIKKLQKQNQLLGDLSGKQRTYNDILKETRSLNEQILDDLRDEVELGDYNERRLRSEKDLASQMQKEQKQLTLLEEKRKELAKKRAHAVKYGGSKERETALEMKKAQLTLNKIIKSQKEKISLTAEEAAHRQEVNEKLGLMDNLVQGLASIPGIGAFVDAEEATEAMEENIREGGTAFKGLLGYAVDTAKANAVDIIGVMAYKSMKDSARGLKDALFEVSELQTQFSNDFGLTNKEASQMRDRMSDIAGSMGSISINSLDAQKAFKTLNDQFGVASGALRDDVVGEVAKLTKLTNMSDESAGRFASTMMRTGKAAGVVTKQARETVRQTANEFGVRLNVNKTLDEAGKITGVMAANMGNNVVNITKALAVTKQLGMTMEDLASASSSMLDFQGSIEAELQAELFTGKQLNLEKARLFALTGDYVGLGKEIKDNLVDEHEWTGMNVLAKQKMAEALGMSADQMSDIIYKGENLAALAEKERENGNYAKADALEKRNLQDQMNDATEKMHMLFVDLMNGPLGMVANLMGAIANNAGLAATAFGLFAAVKVGGLLASLATMAVKLGFISAEALLANSALTFGVGIVLAIAAVAAGIAAFNSMQKPDDSMEDGVIGSDGGMVVSGPKGSIQLNKDDSIIAGTNLGGGGGKNNTREERYQAESIALLKRISIATAASGVGSMVASIAYNGFDAVKADTHYNTKFR